MPSKYGNQKVVIGNQIFDSGREYKRWCELKLLERAGEISDLRRQVKYELIPPQDGERACNYIADFVYTENGKTVVEDAKGYRTKEYIIKRKLLLQKFGLRISEV